MRFPKPFKSRSKTTRLVQVGIWVVFGIALLIGFSTASAALPHSPTSPAAAATVTTAQHPQETAAARPDGPYLPGQPAPQNKAWSAAGSGGAVVTEASGPGGPALTGATPCPSQLDVYYTAGSSATNNCRGGPTAASYTGLLPAYRWRSAVSLASEPGEIPNIAQEMLNAVAQFIFLIASWAWWLLLEVAQFGLTANLLSHATRAVDLAFVNLAGALGGSGIWVVMVALAAIAAVGAALRGNLPRVLRIFFSLVIPVAIVMAISSAAASGNPQSCTTSGGRTTCTATATTSSYTPPVGSPSWIATTGNGYVTSIVNGFNSGLATISGGAYSATALVPKSSNPNSDLAASPSCVQFDQTLYQQYINYANGSQNAAMGNLPVISEVWQKSFLSFWQTAQFGSSQFAPLVACHMLERNSNVPAGEERELFILAYQPSMGKSLVGSGSSSPNIGVLEVLAQNGGSAPHNLDSMLYGFAACYWSGGSWHYRNGWQYADTLSPSGGAPAAQACNQWWTTGNTGNNFFFSTASNYDAIPSLPQAQPSNSSPATAQRIQSIYNMVNSFAGNDPGTQLINAMMAAGTAVLYLWALGPIALGSAIAQIGLILMLILLPATLWLIAWPSLRASRSGRNERSGGSAIGARMLRTTVGFFAAKFALLLVLTFLFAAIVLLEQILAAIGGSAGTFFQLFVPIAALLLVRYLIKMAGMGNITSLSGAMALPAAGAMAMAGSTQAERRQLAESHSRTIGKRTGLDALNKFARRQTLTRASRQLTGLRAAAPAYAKSALAGFSAEHGLTGLTGRLLGRKDMLPEGRAGGYLNMLHSAAGLSLLAQQTRLGRWASDSKAGKALASSGAGRRIAALAQDPYNRSTAEGDAFGLLTSNLSRKAISAAARGQTFDINAELIPALAGSPGALAALQRWNPKVNVGEIMATSPQELTGLAEVVALASVVKGDVAKSEHRLENLAHTATATRERTVEVLRTVERDRVTNRALANEVRRDAPSATFAETGDALAREMRGGLQNSAFSASLAREIGQAVAKGISASQEQQLDALSKIERKLRILDEFRTDKRE